MVLPRTEPPQAAMTLLRHGALALVIDGDDRLDDAQRRAVILRRS